MMSNGGTQKKINKLTFIKNLDSTRGGAQETIELRNNVEKGKELGTLGVVLAFSEETSEEGCGVVDCFLLEYLLIYCLFKG